MARMAHRWAKGDGVHQLHLGCGWTLLPGWLNVDLLGRKRVDLALDLERPLPFPDRSIDAIFHEHMLEHLAYQPAFSHLAECARVLRRGGVLRIGVPDFGRYMQSYVSRTDFIEITRPNRLSPLIAVAEVVYGHGHQSVWDDETLTKLLEELGIDATPVDFGQSRIEPCPDSSDREHETLYIEGIKVR